MNCEICALDSSADPIMWACVGCQRKFHAACVGVPVQRNSLRKREKTVDISSYMLPCCSTCQNLVTASLEFNTLVEQQARMVDQINKNTEVIHRLALQQEKPSDAHETLEGLEILLASIKNELSAINKSSSLAGSVVAIKNHVTSVFDTAILSTNERISNSLKSVTSELAVDLRNINNEICQLNQMALESATTSTMHSNPMLGIDILDELKSLSANIMASQSTAPSPLTPDPCLSLATEMNDEKQGWRLLGARKVWKADWTQYDARKSHRMTQQKLADKAKKRRKHDKATYLSMNNKNNNNNNKTHSFNNQNTNNNNNYNNNNYSSNQRNLNFISNHSSNSCLPPDRELLAAAKDRFSRPPTNYRPTIPFQSGGIINQYPASDVLPPSAPAHSPNWMVPGSSTAVPCEACSCRHSCFPRH